MVKELTIKYGYEIDEEIYKLCDYVDRNVYEEKYCGFGDNGIRRFNHDKNSYVCLCDEENEESLVVGYIEFFPVNKKMHEEILVTSPFIHDDEIVPETISGFKKTSGMTKWSEKGENYVYLLSVAIHKDYREKENLIKLTTAFLGYLSELNEKYPIADITATTVTKNGRRFANRLWMEPIRTLGVGETVHQLSGEGLKKALANELNFAPLPEDVFMAECETGEKEYVHKFASTSVQEQEGEQKRLYKKSFKDDIYMLIPLADHKENTRLDGLFDTPEWSEEKLDAFDIDLEDEIASAFIGQMYYNIEYEVDNKVVEELEMRYMGTWNFLHVNDEYMAPSKGLKEAYLKEHPEASLMDALSKGTLTTADEERASGELYRDGSPIVNEIIGLPEGRVYLLAHRPTHMYVLIIQFLDYKYSSSGLLDQMSDQYLKIVDPVRRDRFISIYDYLLYRYGLHRCGAEKAIVAMDKKPEDNEFKYILLAESYTSKIILNYPINPRIDEAIAKNCSQYSDYESYISEKVIAYIYGNGYAEDTIERVEEITEYLFVPIMVMLQNTAVVKMNTKVTNALASNGEISQDYILSLQRDYGRTVRFWQRDCFKYAGAIHEAETINEAFDSSGILDDYMMQQEYIQNIMEMSSAREENRSSTYLNLFLLVLTFFQVSEFFETKLWTKFYEWAGIVDVTQSASDIESQVQGLVDISSITTIIGLSVLIIALVLNNKYRKHNNIHRREGK